MWKQINLSLKGKVTVINSLAASLLVYPQTALDTPENIIEATEKICCEFLWNGQVNKIARNIMIKQIEQGGLKLIDMTSKIKSPKMTWVKHAINKATSSWKLILDDIIGLHFEHLLGYTGISKNILEKLPKCYRNIMHDLTTLCNKKPNAISEISHETLWFNRNITVDHNSEF